MKQGMLRMHFAEEDAASRHHRRFLHGARWGFISTYRRWDRGRRDRPPCRGVSFYGGTVNARDRNE